MNMPSVKSLTALTAIGIMVAGLSMGCRPAPEPPAEPPNVILVVVDTLRAKSLGLYGYDRNTSPNLEGLAAESVVFEQARSQAPCTYPSVNSILTSRHPRSFIGQPEGRMGIPESIPSIAELLGSQGYSTGAITASPIMRQTPSRFNPTGGFGRGFDEFIEGCIWRAANCVNQRASKLVRSLEEPFFLYLHYMDPHGPFNPPKSWERQFSDPDFDGPEWALKGDVNPAARAVTADGPTAADPAVVSHLNDLYDDEIAYFDQEFAAFIDHLRRAGILEEALLIITADHGEQFLDHGELKHCKDLYDEEIHIPMLIRPPGGVDGWRVETVVRNLDLVPTILSFAGRADDVTSVADSGNSGDSGDSGDSEKDLLLEGLSLRPWLEQAPSIPVEDSEVAFSTWGTARAVTDGRWKMIYRIPDKQFELFDLAVDPEERLNVATEQPEEVRRLRRQLFAWLIEHEGASSGSDLGKAEEEAREQLKALGYIQ